MTADDERKAALERIQAEENAKLHAYYKVAEAEHRNAVDIVNRMGTAEDKASVEAGMSGIPLFDLARKLVGKVEFNRLRSIALGYLGTPAKPADGKLNLPYD